MIYTIVIDGGASLGNEQTAAAFIAHTIKTDIGEALRLVRLAGRIPVWQGGDLSAAVAIHSSLSSAGFVCRIDQIILPSPDQAVNASTTETSSSTPTGNSPPPPLTRSPQSTVSALHATSAQQTTQQEANEPVSPPPAHTAKIAPPPPPPGKTGESPGFAKGIANRVTSLTGTEEISGFNLQDFFSDVLKKRTTDEKEQYLLVGARSTTPSLSEVESNWPKPWLFARALFFSFSIYLIFLFGYRIFNNTNLLPGLMIVGSFVVPISALVLFFELNTPRNVSVSLVTRFVLVGGAISLFTSLILFEVTGELGEILGASVAGLVEETGKLAAVIFVARNLSTVRYRFELNGLLFGAAVATGFAAFESAGYAFTAFYAGLKEGGLEMGIASMERSIQLRGMLSPFGHIVWTALTASALWKVKGARSFNSDMLGDSRFWRVYLFSVCLHALWNSPLAGLFANLFPFLIHLALGVIGWVAVFAAIQSGLKQIRREQSQMQIQPTNN